MPTKIKKGKIINENGINYIALTAFSDELRTFIKRNISHCDIIKRNNLIFIKENTRVSGEILNVTASVLEQIMYLKYLNFERVNVFIQDCIGLEEELSFINGEIIEFVSSVPCEFHFRKFKNKINFIYFRNVHPFFDKNEELDRVLLENTYITDDVIKPFSVCELVDCSGDKLNIVLKQSCQMNVSNCNINELTIDNRKETDSYVKIIQSKIKVLEIFNTRVVTIYDIFQSSIESFNCENVVAESFFLINSSINNEFTLPKVIEMTVINTLCPKINVPSLEELKNKGLSTKIGEFDYFYGFKNTPQELMFEIENDIRKMTILRPRSFDLSSRSKFYRVQVTTPNSMKICTGIVKGYIQNENKYIKEDEDEIKLSDAILSKEIQKMYLAELRKKKSLYRIEKKEVYVRKVMPKFISTQRKNELVLNCVDNVFDLNDLEYLNLSVNYYPRLNIKIKNDDVIELKNIHKLNQYIKEKFVIFDFSHPVKLSFDFSHPVKLSDDDKVKYNSINILFNDRISTNIVPVNFKVNFVFEKISSYRNNHGCHILYIINRENYFRNKEWFKNIHINLDDYEEKKSAKITFDLASFKSEDSVEFDDNYEMFNLPNECEIEIETNFVETLKLPMENKENVDIKIIKGTNTEKKEGFVNIIEGFSNINCLDFRLSPFTIEDKILFINSKSDLTEIKDIRGFGNTDSFYGVSIKRED